MIALIYGEVVEGCFDDFEKYIQSKLFSSASLFGRIGLVLVCGMVIVLEFMYVKFSIPLLLGLIGAVYYAIWLVRDSMARLSEMNKLLDEGNYGIVYLPIEKKYFESTSKSKKVERGNWHFVIQGYEDYVVDEETAESYEEEDLYPCLMYKLNDDDMKVMLLPDWMITREDEELQEDKDDVE